ncbi:MAG: DUF6514 family protein [Clostridiaceae bacterium]
MVVLQNKEIREMAEDSYRFEYAYRIVENHYENILGYGIEAEKKTYVSENLEGIEREYIKVISPIYSKVEDMVDILYNHRVSPIHLVDVLGERIDECTFDF